MVDTVNREAVQASVQDLAAYMQSILSRRLTAYVVGVKDAKAVSRWASGETTRIRDAGVETRLRAAYQIAQLLSEVESAPTVKAWFISLNPYLDDVTPAEFIRDGKGREALAAARAFVTTA